MVPTVLPDLQLHTDDYCSSEQICGDLGFISNIFGEDFLEQTVNGARLDRFLTKFRFKCKVRTS